MTAATPIPHFGSPATASTPSNTTPNEFHIVTRSSTVIQIHASDYYLAEGFVVFRDTEGKPLRAQRLDGVTEIRTVKA